MLVLDRETKIHHVLSCLPSRYAIDLIYVQDHTLHSKVSSGAIYSLMEIE